VGELEEMMEYKIIPADVIKSIIEFLDEVQFDAAESQAPEDYHKINFCNWVIGELMNGIDGVDLTENNDEDADIDMEDRFDAIGKYRKEFGMDFPEDMSEEEWKKLIKQFDSFIEGWDNAYTKSNFKDNAKRNGLKKFLEELKIDHKLTPQEKFELYYEEYRDRKREKESNSLSVLLDKAGIKKPPPNKQTPKK